MARVPRGLKSLFQVELRSDILADALAHEKAGGGHVRADDLVLPRHLISLYLPRKSEREGGENETLEIEELQNSGAISENQRSAGVDKGQKNWR